jgi:hypothetical protein
VPGGAREKMRKAFTGYVSKDGNILALEAIDGGYITYISRKKIFTYLSQKGIPEEILEEFNEEILSEKVHIFGKELFP